MDADEFFKRVSTRSGIHGRDRVIAATASVLQALRARISHDTGDNMASQLPTEIREMWKSPPTGLQVMKEVEFERMDLDEFLERIRTSIGLTGRREAAEVARAVFMTIQEQITPGAADHVASELPEDIRAFWEESAPQQRPIESPASRRPRTFGFRLRFDRPALEPTKKGPPEGFYTSDEIGPSVATVCRSDEQLRDEIIELLEASDEVDASDIEVEVHAGKVTLRGTVTSPYQREAAKRIAKEALGTIEVINNIRLRML
jgi:uncharacterized protein (DUF2267 family)